VSTPVARGYAIAAAALGAVMLALFGLAHALGAPVLTDASPDLGAAGPGAAGASFALLAFDVVLPVPASAVMTANGALFGPLGGALLSLAGAEAAALLGFAIGRRGGVLLDRVVSPDQRARAAPALEQPGMLAIALTRPVPVVAETTAILAGAAGMSLGRLAGAAAIGSIPPAVAYALAGANAESYGGTPAVFAGVILLSAAMWALTGRSWVAAATHRAASRPPLSLRRPSRHASPRR
jgi:uncharacterized membrane protein YdjX (TVP38/TMEM64 family)